MFANPAVMPLICGGVFGDVAPVAMKILCVTVTLEVSLLTSVRKTPPAGAGADKVTGKDTDCPTVNVVLPGKLIAAA